MSKVVALVLIAIFMLGCHQYAEKNIEREPELRRAGDFLVINGQAVNIYTIIYIKSYRTAFGYETVVRQDQRSFYIYKGNRQDCERIRDRIVGIVEAQ